MIGLVEIMQIKNLKKYKFKKISKLLNKVSITFLREFRKA